MALNPMQIIQLKDKLNGFRNRHPGFVGFIGALRREGVPEGSVLDIRFTSPDGRTSATHFRVTQEDLDFLRTISELGK